MEEYLWSTVEAARLTGVSVDMLNYFQRTGIFEAHKQKLLPRTRGRPRAYMFTDLVLLCAIAVLADSGVSVLRLKKAINMARKRAITVGAASISARYILANGRDAQFCSGRDLPARMKALGTTAILIDLEAIRRELLGKLGDGV